jgi:hypothetical protein
LGPDVVSKIAAEQRRQVPRFEQPKDRFLRLDRAGRIDKQLITLLMPALQRFNASG